MYEYFPIQLKYFFITLKQIRLLQYYCANLSRPLRILLYPGLEYCGDRGNSPTLLCEYC